jgi:hypothetical protein
VKKKITAEDLTASAWAAALSDICPPADIVPHGWLTAKELARQTRTPVPTLQAKLKQLVEQGKAERKKFRIRLEKNVRPVPHYKLRNP